MAVHAIVTQSVSRRFNDTPALEDVTFSIAYGRIAALVGPNGSGKSTLMRILLGLLRPTTGQVTVLGMDPFAQAETLRRHTGMLLDTRKDPANLSVFESLQVAGQPSHPGTDSGPPSTKITLPVPLPQHTIQSPAERAARIDDLLYRFDLWPHRHHRVVDLSHSEREKLAVVATLVNKPVLLLLDEPLIALDAEHRAHSLDILRDILRQDQATLLFSTNALEDAQAIADDLVVLAHGRVTVFGPTAELLTAPSLPTLEITGRGINGDILVLLQRRAEVAGARTQGDTLHIRFNRLCDTAPIVSLLVESGVDIEEVHKRAWDLRARYHQLLHPAESPPLSPSS